MAMMKRRRVRRVAKLVADKWFVSLNEQLIEAVREQHEALGAVGAQLENARSLLQRRNTEITRLRAWLRLVEATTDPENGYYALHGYDAPRDDFIAHERIFPPGCQFPHRAWQAACALLRERLRQGAAWSNLHDDRHVDGELALAAATYALPPNDRGAYVYQAGLEDSVQLGALVWPFEDEAWKPGDRVRELEKAGAFVIAEIERLQRAEA